MEEYHKDAINRNLPKLCKDLILEPLLTILLQDGVFTDVSVEFIKAAQTDYSRCQKLCIDLKKRGPKAFGKFIKALFESEQEHLAEMLLLKAYNLKNGTNITRYSHLPSDTRMEAGGGCISKQHMQPARTRQGNPITHPSDECGVSGDSRTSEASVGQAYYNPRHRSTEIYRMESNPRGFILIINNANFDHLENRVGSVEDVEALDRIFTKIGFKPIKRTDLTARRMIHEMSTFSEMSEHENVDSMIVALLSHGVEGGICGKDSKEEEKIAPDGTSYREMENVVKIKDIETMFNSENCHQLMNKPKLFIIQACRGEKHDRGVWASDGGSPDKEFAEQLKRKRRELCAPTYADIIFAYATISEHRAFRNTRYGSPYIQELCRVFSEDAKDDHVCDMLTKVTDRIAKMDMSSDTEASKMLPQKIDQLRKKWYLNPIG